ncbi:MULTISPECIES: hypothetical protein [unclassified Dietzia]|uniref:hypothetical protein n=1 Tax=unclassified Dietzia TaxID=2617939 RepID=UPI0015F88F02|nr:MULTISPECIES: hypothetical protein [unclassified Dietzia]MBB1023336.1 hypothetical protein [Dietzia sp. DQ12-76]MBB1027533.1 hypothetical protein [Dietzia sp. DQ11-38-2]
MHTFEFGKSTVVVDPGARTITFNHSEFGPRKANSPWVVPTGAIESVEHKKKAFMSPAGVRLMLKDRSGYHPVWTDDMSAVVGKRHPDELAQLAELAEQMAAADQSAASPELRVPLNGQFMSVPGILDVFGDIVLDEHAIYFQGRACRLEGSHAELVDANAARSRVTATRVAAGAVIAGPVGALVGGMAKKKTGEVYVMVTASDGRVLSASGKGSDLAKAAEIVAKINARS